MWIQVDKAHHVLAAVHATLPCIKLFRSQTIALGEEPKYSSSGMLGSDTAIGGCLRPSQNSDKSILTIAAAEGTHYTPAGEDPADNREWGYSVQHPETENFIASASGSSTKHPN